jgi:hypothetical protein
LYYEVDKSRMGASLGEELENFTGKEVPCLYVDPILLPPILTENATDCQYLLTRLYEQA